VDDRDAQPAEDEPQHDPAAPHTAPFPSHIPRWLAWLLLLAFAASGLVCVRVVLSA
jgi:hypothetical protein